MTFNRSTLVTGASRGIGQGIALSLARQAFNLTISSRNEGDLETLATVLLALTEAITLVRSH